MISETKCPDKYYDDYKYYNGKNENGYTLKKKGK
jgi:hypothetical protein